MTQKLEGIFSKSLKLNKNLYGMKLQVNQLAHQTVPADFVVFNQVGDVQFVECKECKLNDKGKGSFGFGRLTQEADLNILQRFSVFMCNYVMILFRAPTLKKSYCFMIPFVEYIKFKHRFTKKSANLGDFKDYLSKYILEPQKGSVYDVSFLEK